MLNNSMPLTIEALELKLLAEKEKTEAIFYGAESPLVIFKGPHFIIEMFNEKYQAIYQDRLINGRPLLEAIPELKETRFPQILNEVYNSGQHYVSHEGCSHLLNVKTGRHEERYFDTSFSRIKYGEDEEYRIIATPREVTERVITRKKLEESLLALEQERDFRDLFIAALSHDLKNPMASIKVASQLLHRKSHEPEAIEAIAHRLISSMEQADHMIGDLLHANRLKAGEMIPLFITECCLSKFLATVVSDLNLLHHNRIKLKLIEQEINGFWDQEGLRRIVENLINNAIKYGNSKSDVTVYLHLNADRVELCVHNLGNPIPLEEQDELFFPYRRSLSAIKSGKQGWGIGLTLVKGYAEAHKGHVKVISNSDHGTSFIVTLPLDAR